MNISEEKLEQQLRALFADERLDLPPPLDAAKSIVEGAQRRRRHRRTMTATTGVVAAAVVITGGLAAFKIQSQESAAVMSGDKPELSVQPPADNLTPGASQPAPGSAPTSTGRLDAPPPGTGAKPSKSTTHPTSTSRPPVTSGPLLGGFEFGALKLGMSETDIVAQGFTLTNKQAIAAGCDTYDVSGAGIPSSATLAISTTFGVAIITPTQTAHTPEGIGAGSTRDEIVLAYPGTTDAPGGVAAPARSVSEYRFRLDAKGAVEMTSLFSTNQDCVS